MNKFVIVCMMYLAVVSMASAGYTDPLWNTSEDRVYYDCGDWSGVDNNPNTDIHKHYYSFKKSVKRNRAYMRNPEHFGIPKDSCLSGGLPQDDITWQPIYINGLTNTLNYNNAIYTNDSRSIDYTNDYLEYRTHNSGLEQIKNLVGKPSSEVVISDTNLKVTTDFEWYDYNDDEYGTHTKIISKKLPSHIIWAIPDCNVNTTLVNHSNYMVLNVPTPENIIGIKIIAKSKNITAIYEKHTHCLKLNTSKPFMTYDLIECKHHNFTEIIPFGPDSYLLQYEPDYDINVTLYTPFETIDAIVTLNETNAEPINTDLKWDSIWDLLYIAVPISLILWLVGSI